MVFKEIEKLIVADGWTLVRIIGSQNQYQKTGINFTVVIPNHKDKDLPTEIVNYLEKRTGLVLQH